MIHHYTKDDNSGDHYGVSYTCELHEEREAKVLVQLQKDGEQVRVAMSPEDAEHMAEQLLMYANLTRNIKKVALHNELNESVIPNKEVIPKGKNKI